MLYFYGPVPSRRLGYSLGVDIIPKKTCVFNCLYCQVGNTTRLTKKRFSYVNYRRFVCELKEILAQRPKIDVITIAGSGEPTLHKRLDKIIDTIKTITKGKYPVCVITNSALLSSKEVRKEIMHADLIIPSLDAATEKTFLVIDRPHRDVKFENIVEGLINLRKEFSGKLWLEIMVLAGFNDTAQEAKAFKKIISKINPDKVQLNLPVRPSGVKISFPSFKRLVALKNMIGAKAEVVSSFYKKAQKQFSQSVQDDIKKFVSIRPASMEDLSNSTGLTHKQLVEDLKLMRKCGEIQETRHHGKKFFIRVLDDD